MDAKNDEGIYIITANVSSLIPMSMPVVDPETQRLDGFKDREDAEDELKGLKEQFPDETFQVKRYVFDKELGL